MDYDQNALFLEQDRILSELEAIATEIMWTVDRIGQTMKEPIPGRDVPESLKSEHMKEQSPPSLIRPDLIAEKTLSGTSELRNDKIQPISWEADVGKPRERICDTKGMQPRHRGRGRGRK